MGYYVAHGFTNPESPRYDREADAAAWKELGPVNTFAIRDNRPRFPQARSNHQDFLPDIAGGTLRRNRSEEPK